MSPVTGMKLILPAQTVEWHNRHNTLGSTSHKTGVNCRFMPRHSNDNQSVAFFLSNSSMSNIANLGYPCHRVGWLPRIEGHAEREKPRLYWYTSPVHPNIHWSSNRYLLFVKLEHSSFDRWVFSNWKSGNGWSSALPWKRQYYKIL